MKQTRIRLFGSVLMIIIIPMALFILGVWKNSDSYLTTQVFISGIAVLVIVAFSMAFWFYGAVILPLERLEQAMREIKNGNFDAPLNTEDVSSEMRGLMDDFEEMRLRLKENQEEKQKADSDAKEFLSNITHDLKTPITSIKGYVEGIQDGVASSPAQMDRYIRTIYNKANEMDHLIDELTFYTKIDANRIPYHFAILPAAQFFADCAEDLRLETEAQGFLFSYAAALGSEVCIAAVIRNSLRYRNTDVLERGYGISLRPLTTFASRIYPDENPIKAAERAVTMMMFKLEGALIRRNPDFQMEDRLLLDKIDFDLSCVTLGSGRRVELESAYFPTIDDPADCWALTEDEENIIADLRSYFLESKALQRHVDYLYERGSIYTCYNGNLLFHACVPMEESGEFRTITYKGQAYRGRAWMDFCEEKAREGWNEHTQEGLDFMYFLWCGYNSPVSGRSFTTFERSFISDESTWKEPSDPYFRLVNDEAVCEKILEEFGLDPKRGHIINGHVPVKVQKGESPLRGSGRALIIDGGFAAPFRAKTGISGYTLIYNSRGLRLLQHQRVASVRDALRENRDIESVSQTVELQARHSLVRDTDRGAAIESKIADLHALLRAYQTGHIKPQ